MSQETGGPDNSFETRLQAARSKQGLDAPPKPDPAVQGGLGGSPWSIGMRVGIELVSALVVAVAIGYGLDRLFHTTPILTVVFVPLGGAAGIINLWRVFVPKDSGSGRK
ncbi:AtpZ/AtpI family protein [Rhodopila sp.]|uniref:AtpZ/AtpI family protein n=1 Tax=Rhodopila sp. TaxID=2480087 RepID=UPI003D0DE685